MLCIFFNMFDIFVFISFFCRWFMWLFIVCVDVFVFVMYVLSNLICVNVWFGILVM